MKKNFLIVGVVGVLVIGIGFYLFSMSSYGPKFDDVKQLVEPRVVTKPSIKALVVEATGDPSRTVGPAFGLLFSTYFKIKDRPKGRSMEAPRARWPKPLDTPRDQWVGMYAMPVPATVQSLPEVKAKAGLRVELRDWQYGEVAEILHVGPYSSEDSTVKKLKKFITGNNYEICGDHEEEYLKGPGLLPTDPKKYLTVIRYQVRKAGGGL